jgi:hypothetical protein
LSVSTNLLNVLHNHAGESSVLFKAVIRLQGLQLDWVVKR